MYNPLLSIYFYLEVADSESDFAFYEKALVLEIFAFYHLS